MIIISDVAKAFGTRDLFVGAQLHVGARDRIALVGPNGSGKTTLIEMIAGLQGPDAGEIQVASGAVVGYLEQDTDALRGRTLLEEVISAAGEVNRAGHLLSVLETEIATLSPGSERDRLVAEYGRLQHRFESLGGYSLEAEAKRILGGLGFGAGDHERPVESFSGGRMMRVALARLLLQGPDVLMLDEPTNHLDLSSVEWLEAFLSSYDGCVLLISHDRDFINSIATRIVEIDGNRLVSYTGDFESFVEQRALRVAGAQAEARNRARKVAQTQRFIERFRYKASKARQVQSRIKSLQKLGTIEAPEARRKAMRLEFPQPLRTGRDVMVLEGVGFAYGTRVVYDALDVVVERAHKAALVGPNGAGKSTLLKLLAGVLEPQSGTRRAGHNVDVAYFAQHQIEALDPAKRVLEELSASMPSGVEVRPRDLLGRFLFSGDDVEKPVSVLSGGERSRLALAKLLVRRPSLLCLDEPTNHLDMQSRDVLEQALSEYRGAIVLITHDRHLIRSVANRIIEVDAGRVTVHDGGYERYLERRRTRAEEEAPEPAPRPRRIEGPKERRRRAARERAHTKALRDRVGVIERELDERAAEMARIEGILADPSAYSSGEDIASLSRAYEAHRGRVTELENAWEDAAGALEAHMGGGEAG